jgi:hypothetical protein
MGLPFIDTESTFCMDQFTVDVNYTTPGQGRYDLSNISI